MLGFVHFNGLKCEKELFLFLECQLQCRRLHGKGHIAEGCGIERSLLDRAACIGQDVKAGTQVHRDPFLEGIGQCEVYLIAQAFPFCGREFLYHAEIVPVQRVSQVLALAKDSQVGIMEAVDGVQVLKPKIHVSAEVVRRTVKPAEALVAIPVVAVVVIAELDAKLWQELVGGHKGFVSFPWMAAMFMWLMSYVFAFFEA